MHATFGGVFMLFMFAGAAPTTQHDPDQNISLVVGHLEIKAYVGQTCKLIFPKNSGNPDFVYLKRTTSREYVGGCRDGNNLTHSNQVEWSDCKMANESFSLTFQSVTRNLTGSYIWKSGGQEGSFHLNVAAQDKETKTWVISISSIGIAGIAGIVVVVVVVFAVILFIKCKTLLKNKYDAYKKKVQGYNFCKI